MITIDDGKSFPVLSIDGNRVLILPRRSADILQEAIDVQCSCLEGLKDGETCWTCRAMETAILVTLTGKPLYLSGAKKALEDYVAL